MSNCESDSKLFNIIVIAFVIVLALNVMCFAISFFMVEQGNTDIIEIKYIVLDIDREVVEITNSIKSLQKDIIQLNKDMVAEFSEEAQLSEIRKSEVMEALKDVE
jgi:hypothetical protein